MKLELQHICPNALSGVTHSSDSVWKNGLTLESAKKVFLSARSGRGKSTFIGIASGIRKDFSGDYFLDGVNSKQLTSEEWSKIRQNKISTIYQDLKLFPELTVRENIEIKNNLTQYKSENEWKELLKKLEIDFKINQKCAELSIGQQQRVAITRALCQPFEWLLMDEPFSHLDKTTINLAVEVIQSEVEKQNAGLILASLGSEYNIQFDQKIVL